jgi:hypothetical protein
MIHSSDTTVCLSIHRMDQQTPEQVVQDLETLTQALAGLYSVTGESTRSVAATHRSSLHTTSRLTPGERTAASSFAVRGNAASIAATRISVPTGVRETHQTSGGSTGRIAARQVSAVCGGQQLPERESRDDYHRLPERQVRTSLDDSHRLPARQSRRSFSDAHSQSYIAGGVPRSDLIPPTTIRRNITTRRSKGRKEDSSKDPHDLAMRRPRGRSRDREYVRQSVGERPKVYGRSLPGEEMLRRTKERMTAEMQARTDSRIASLLSPDRHDRNTVQTPRTRVHRPIFLKRDIPPHSDAPQVNEDLLDLWAIRLQYQEDREEANNDGDDIRHDLAQHHFDDCNERMHELFDFYMDEKERSSSTAPSSGLSITPEPPPRDFDREELPPNVLESHNKREVHHHDSGGPDRYDSGEHVCQNSSPQYVDIDELPLPVVYRPTDGDSTKPSPLLRTGPPGCPPNQLSFRIWFGYSGLEQSMMVWDSLPLKTLHTFAWNWIMQTFDGEYMEHAIVLVRTAGVGSCDEVLSRAGFVFSIPLHDDDLLEISFRMPEMVTPPREPSVERSDAHTSAGNDHHTHRLESAGDLGLSKSFDKLRQNFKCPKFSGLAKDWKLWNQGFMRFLSIWELDHVTDPEFFDVLPLTSTQRRDNKMVFYILEEAVQGSPMARSYIQKAPLNNGFEAYYTLLDGFVFAGATTASLLLNELTNFRFKKDETPTMFCLRLEELFQDLKSLPGDAAMVFNDTQCIGYLLSALRHEKEWATVHSSITSDQIKGKITFTDACNELRVRCEASRVNDLMDRPVGGKKVTTLVSKTTEPSTVSKTAEPSTESLTADQVLAFISTMAMKHNTPVATDPNTTRKKGGKGKGDKPLHPCLSKTCNEQTIFPLCGTCYHSLIAAKVDSIELEQNYGLATYNTDTKLVVYPAKVPSDRMPSNIKRVRGAAA